MKIQDIKKVLTYMIEANITPNIIGGHGKGKSQVIKQFAKENGYGRVLEIRLGQIQDPGDLQGLPNFKDLEGRQVTSFITPSFFPHGDEKAIVFLDEYNRCPPQLLQSIFQLIEMEGRLGEYKLPKDCAVILASNPPTDEYTVTDMTDKALNDRMCPIKFTPTQDEFFSYMESKGADQAMIAFLRDQPTSLEIEGSGFSIEDMVSPSRRSWDSVDRLLKTGIKDDVHNSVFVELLGGLVGPSHAQSYNSFISNYDVRVSGIDIIKKYKTVKKKIDFERIDALNTSLDEIFSELVNNSDIVKKEKHVENVFTFLADIPRDLSKAFFTRTIESTYKDDEGKEKPLIIKEVLLENFCKFGSNDKLRTLVKDNFFGLLKEEEN